MQFGNSAHRLIKAVLVSTVLTSKTVDNFTHAELTSYIILRPIICGFKKPQIVRLTELTAINLTLKVGVQIINKNSDKIKMISMLKNTLHICRTGLNVLNQSSRLNHVLTSPAAMGQNSNFLAPFVPEFVSKCGLKVKGLPRRRCKDCFFVTRDERLYVECKTHPRHKQVQIAKNPKNTWILTHATQGKVRPW